MEIKADKRYLIKIKSEDSFLHFNAKIISLSDNFIEFEDKFGDMFVFNSQFIISIQEVKDEKKD